LPIVVVVAAALPAKSVDLEMVLLLAISVLDPIVEQDYVLVYVHSGLTSENRPAFAFLSKCYKMFNRKYKKNLKRLYIVHPTFWVRTSFALFRPFLSAKFWRKLVYINAVDELDKTIDRSQITLPRVALEHGASAAQPAPRERVMGVPLAELLARSSIASPATAGPDASGQQLPLFLEQSLTYLRANAHVEGILRLSGSILEIKKLAAAVDEGRFDAFAASLTDPHVVGGFVKLWMRELPDPVVPHALYDKFVVAARDAPPAPSIAGTDDDEPRADGPSPVTRAVEPVLKQLAAPNRRVLAALLNLCGQFHAQRAVNRMTARNLGIVMAPNMLSCPGHDMAVTLQNTPLLNESVRWLIIDHKYVVASLSTSV
jgi:Rho GTPase-activating protein 1